MDKVKVSIIIPLFNAEDYLDRCLHSVLDQDFPSFEVILVDDGSTDSSPLICDRYSATDSRFRTIHKPNGGVSSARNAGLELAKGEYIMFLDSDDALLPDGLDVMMEKVNGEDMVIAGYGVFYDGVPGKDIRPYATRSYSAEEMSDFYQDNIRRNCEMLDAPWAKLFRRKTIGGTRFCQDLSYAEDKLFVFEILSNCSSVLTVSAAVYGYYLRAGSLGSDISSDRHIMQLKRFIPKYSVLLSTLANKYPSSVRVQLLYHNDLVGRYLCRILNVFASRTSGLLDEENIAWVYSFMDEDKDLGVFSLRPGQVLNIMLYKRKCPAFSVKAYKFLSKFGRLFKRA